MKVTWTVFLSYSIDCLNFNVTEDLGPRLSVQKYTLIYHGEQDKNMNDDLMCQTLTAASQVISFLGLR